MCGRTACALAKDALRYACGRENSSGECFALDWVNMNKGVDYRPSYNIAPKSYGPVVLNRVVAEDPSPSGADPVVSLLRWGLVPRWFKGDDFAANTINCRVEDCFAKPTYKPAIENNQRCVVLAEGFFEWEDLGKGGRQPYMVYFEQPEGISMSDRFWDGVEDGKKLLRKGRYVGPRLLTMAGLYDTSTFQGGLVSYTVLTMEAPKWFQWLHNRVPVILDGEEAVSRWLDRGVSFHELTNNLECPNNLRWHPVSKEVGRVTNNSVNCVLPIPKTEPKENKPTLMDTWLKRPATQATKQIKQEVKTEPRAAPEKRLRAGSDADCPERKLQRSDAGQCSRPGQRDSQGGKDTEEGHGQSTCDCCSSCC